MGYIIRAVVAIIITVLIFTYLLPLIAITGTIATLLKLVIVLLALWYIYSGPEINLPSR